MCRFQKCLYLILRMLPRRVTGFAEKSSSPLLELNADPNTPKFYNSPRCLWWPGLTWTKINDHPIGRKVTLIVTNHRQSKWQVGDNNQNKNTKWSKNVTRTLKRPVECAGWRRHSSLIFLILLFTKPNIEASGWLYHTKNTHHSPFSRVTPPNYIALNKFF